MGVLGQGWGDLSEPLLSGCPARPPLLPSLCARAGSQASCPDRRGIPRIGLHLSVSPSRQHADTAAARLIFLIHRSAHLSPCPRSPSGSIVGRGKPSPGWGAESRPSCLGPADLAAVSPMDPFHSLGEPLDSWSPCSPFSAPGLMLPSAGDALHGVLLCTDTGLSWV